MNWAAVARAFALALAIFCGVRSSDVRAVDAPPLVLEATISLENTSGRIDHMAVDLKRHRLFVAELGNGSVDVIDLAARRVISRISGLREPQGVGYSEKADLLAVASAGDGSVRFYKGEDLAPLGTLSLGDDADNVRIDAQSGNIIVCYGSGGLAIIDPITRTLVSDISLPKHPEGFQLDNASGRLFVNIPDAHQIAAIDVKAGRISAVWRVQGVAGNFPMAFAPEEHLLAVVFRSPPRLVLLDANNGAITATLHACDDADDVFLDEKRKRFYASCGNGEVDTWRSEESRYRALPSILAGGSTRTSLFVPTLDRLFVARRAGVLGSEAAILVYQPKD